MFQIEMHLRTTASAMWRSRRADSCTHFAAVVLCILSRASLANDVDTDVVIYDAGNTCAGGGWSKITTLAACRSAIELLGYDGTKYRGDEDEASWPSGCYFCAGVPGCTNGFWFNERASGSANGGAAPVCERGLTPLNGSTSVVFMGDSDVDYWPDTGGAVSPSHNVAVGGYTCQDVKREADEMLASFAGAHFEWIVVVCGENDLAYGASVETAFDRFNRIVSKATEAGVRVLYLGTKPEPSTSGLHDEYRAYDARVRALATSLANSTTTTATAAGAAGAATPFLPAAAALPPLVMVDVYPAFEALGNPASLYASDELHLSALGYEKWTKWTRLALNRTAAAAALDPAGTCVRWLSGVCDEFRGSTLAPTTAHEEESGRRRKRGDDDEGIIPGVGAAVGTYIAAAAAAVLVVSAASFVAFSYLQASKQRANASEETSGGDGDMHGDMGGDGGLVGVL